MNLFTLFKNMVKPTWTRPELLGGGVSIQTNSGQYVSVESAKRISTYFRCLNTITDDLSVIPLQQFIKRSSTDIQRVLPDGFWWNMAYSVEVRPNPYQTPLQLKKKFWTYLLETGDSYLWTPAGTRQLYTLNANLTTVEPDDKGNYWYVTRMNDGINKKLPPAEVLHLLINPKSDFSGRGIIEYARDTIGIRQAGNATRASMFKRGLMPSGIAEFDGTLNKEARQRVRDAYWEAVSGADQAGGVVVLDGDVKKFTLAEIKPIDAQFLESINATDADIANFFSFPLYKLNQGKQSYESNDQQDEDYLRSTLDTYLVQMEQAARINWLTVQEQTNSYWKFNREAFLRMNSKARSAYLKEKILSAQYTPNQALAVDDLPGYAGGDVHFVPSNMAVIHEDGKIEAISQATTDPGGE